MHPDLTIASEGELYDYEEELHEDMDGDAESALTSAGWGVDESYTMENDYFDDF